MQSGSQDTSQVPSCTIYCTSQRTVNMASLSFDTIIILRTNSSIQHRSGNFPRVKSQVMGNGELHVTTPNYHTEVASIISL